MTISGAGSGSSSGVAAGDVAGVGTDGFTGVNAVRGSQFNDVIAVTGGTGVNYNLDGQGGDDTITGGSGNDTLTGGAGNDTIMGGTGIDIAVYTGARANYTIDPNTSAGHTFVTDNRAGSPDGADDVANGASGANAVELLRFTDMFVMNITSLNLSGFTTTAGATVTGTNNASGDTLTINLTGTPSTINLAGGGTDTLILGQAGTYTLALTNTEVVTGSGGNDTLNLSTGQSGTAINLGNGIDTLNLIGVGNSVTITGVENVNGGAGVDTVTLGAASTVSMNFVENVIGSAGIDNVTFSGNATMTNVENIHGSVGFDTLTLGATNTVAVTVNSVETVTGTIGDDHVTVTTDAGVSVINGMNVDLGGGNDALTLNVVGASSSVTLNVNNVETISSAGGLATLTLTNAVNGITIDLGTGFSTVNLGPGDNTATINNVEAINDIGTGNDNITVSLDPAIVNQTINLGFGTDTLTLAGVSGNFSVSLSSSNLTVIGATTGSGNEHINLLNLQTDTTFDLGAGSDDSVTLFGQTGLVNTVTVKNVETVTGSSEDDYITVANTAGANTTTVTGGWGGDIMTASAGADHFRYTSTTDSPTTGPHDIITNFDAANDAFVFTTAVGLQNNTINYVGTNGFDGGGVSEARLDTSGGQPLLQIDVDGDGVMTANDMVIELHNLNGLLSNSNFLIG